MPYGRHGHGIGGRHVRQARFGMLPRALITAGCLVGPVVTLCAAPFILLGAVWRTLDAALRGDLWRRPPPKLDPSAWGPRASVGHMDPDLPYADDPDVLALDAEYRARAEDARTWTRNARRNAAR